MDGAQWLKADGSSSLAVGWDVRAWLLQAAKHDAAPGGQKAQGIQRTVGDWRLQDGTEGPMAPGSDEEKSAAQRQGRNELGSSRLWQKEVGFSMLGRRDLDCSRIARKKLGGSFRAVPGWDGGCQRLNAEAEGVRSLRTGTKIAQRLQAAENDGAPNGQMWLQNVEYDVAC